MATGRKRSVRKVLLGVAVGLAITVWGSLKGAEIAAANEVRAEASKLRKLGYPITPDELRAKLPKDGEDNAANIYYRAIAVYGDLGKPTDNFKDAKGNRDPHKRASFIMITEPVYPLIVQASEKPYCVFSRQWEDGVRLGFPEMADMRQFVYILRDRAVHSSMIGQWQKSLDDLSVGLRVSKHVQEPTLIGHLVAIATDMIVLRSFLEVCGNQSKNPEFLKAARTWLKNIPPPPDRARAFDFELVGLERTLEQISQPEIAEEIGMDTEEFAGVAVRTYLRFPFARKRVEANYYRELRLTLEAPYENQHADLARWNEFDSRTRENESLPGRLTMLFFPMLSQTAYAFARVVDNRRMADVALWVLEQRLQHGVMPHQLPDSERFQDVYSGKRYVYSKNPDGFLIRSLGPNQVDEGGKADPETGSDDVQVQVNFNTPNPWAHR